MHSEINNNKCLMNMLRIFYAYFQLQLFNNICNFMKKTKHEWCEMHLVKKKNVKD